MKHVILLKGTKYAVDLILSNGVRAEDGKFKEEDSKENIEYKKEYDGDDIKKMIKDLQQAAKESDFQGELIIYEISKAYGVIEETHKKDIYEEGDKGKKVKTTEEIQYMAFRLIPSYNKVDKYKF